MPDGQKSAVFVFTTAYFPLIGGAEIAIQEVQERLQDKFDFFIFTARFRRDLPRREVRGGATIIRIGVGSWLDKWLLVFLGPCTAIRWLRREQRRVLFWGVDISQGAIAAAFAKLLRPRVPFILTVQYGYGGSRLAGGRLGLIGFGYRFMLWQADSVTAISNFLASTAKHFGYTRNIAVIPNGVAIERFEGPPKRRIDLEHPIVITVSRLVHKNGVDTLIRAIDEVRRSIPGVHCHILGDGPKRRELETLSHSLGLSEYIRFFGNIPNTDISKYLRAADVFARPARSEGMGNAFVEAIAAGLPIVGTAVEGIPDIIEDGKTGLFTNVDDPSDCAKQILRLLGDQQLREQLVLHGREMVRERFSWDTIARAYASLFEVNLALRILIATPMFPSDIGGPGAYAEHLASECAARGLSVSVLCYGREGIPDSSFRVRRISRDIPSGLKHLWFAFKAWQMLGRSDVVLVFDPVIVGAPIVLARSFRRRPMFFRIEGDFLWEWFSERTREEQTLRKFYETFHTHRFNLKEEIMHWIERWVISRADAFAFSSKWRETIFNIGYPLSEGRHFLILPAVPEPRNTNAKREQIFRFIGRFVRVKNIPRLIRAFLDVAGPEWRLELIGEGPMQGELEKIIRDAGARERIMIIPSLGKEAVIQKIAQAHALLLPSISDVSPNIILDCIASGTPFLLTKETGFQEILGDMVPWVDPLDEADLRAKLKLLLQPDSYERYKKHLGTLKARPWSAVTDDWLKLLNAHI